MSDIINTYIEYLKYDCIGPVSNKHLVMADKNGIECEECIELAQIHNLAVDFGKHGKFHKKKPIFHIKNLFYRCHCGKILNL